ncbi:MAG: hypothetical protein II937_13495 [Bacteroidales bacterium]|nr:hypothetical protein [Bacteroidales bacterium]
MNNNDSQIIVTRFFSALDALIVEKKIRGVKTFTDKYGIDNRNLYTLRKRPSYGIFQVSWLMYLVSDFGISAQWLLTGTGSMFTRNVQDTCTTEMLSPQGVD